MQKVYPLQLQLFSCSCVFSDSRKIDDLNSTASSHDLQPDLEEMSSSLIINMFRLNCNVFTHRPGNKDNEVGSV